MHRFFVEKNQIEENQIRITGNDVNHIKNVLRMKEQQEIYISDGEKMEYTCYIESMSPDEIIAHIQFVEESGLELPAQIYLFQGLPKNDKMELIIQKAVELGACEIIPVSTRRTIVKLDKKKEAAKQKRWQGIAESAAKQSKRMYIPQIHEVLTFSQAVDYAKEMNVGLIPYELAKGMKETKQIINSIKPGDKVAVFIGPEGGFAEEEVALAMENHIQPITLGKRILRTETAGFTVLSILMYHLEQE